MIAQEATLQPTATGKLWRPLARNKSFDCPEVAVGVRRFRRKFVARKSMPRWRGPFAVVDINEMSVAAKFEGQIPRVARYCVR